MSFFSFKRIFDIVFAILGLIIIFFPSIIIILIIFFTSGKPIFHLSRRIGRNDITFIMPKFRTMRTNAPDIASNNFKNPEEYVTSVGRILRKYSLDELPQLWSILIGKMSFVGPRPERQFYAEKLIAKAPHYKHIYKVKPGITSWGMVKFGYAENLEEMLERLKYDILYIENMSFLIDLKILIYTVLIILQGRGK